MPSHITTLSLLLLPSLALSLSHSHSQFHTHTSNPCTAKKYENYLTLSLYPPAQSYCTHHHPPHTTTVLSTTLVAPAGHEHTHTHTTATTQKVGSGAAPSRNRFIPAAAPDERQRGQDWDSAQESGKAFVSTLCGCIEKGVTKTVS